MSSSTDSTDEPSSSVPSGMLHPLDALRQNPVLQSPAGPGNSDSSGNDDSLPALLPYALDPKARAKFCGEADGFVPYVLDSADCSAPMPAWLLLRIIHRAEVRFWGLLFRDHQIELIAQRNTQTFRDWSQILANYTGDLFQHLLDVAEGTYSLHPLASLDKGNVTAASVPYSPEEAHLLENRETNAHWVAMQVIRSHVLPILDRKRCLMTQSWLKTWKSDVRKAAGHFDIADLHAQRQVDTKKRHGDLMDYFTAHGPAPQLPVGTQVFEDDAMLACAVLLHELGTVSIGTAPDCVHDDCADPNFAILSHPDADMRGPRYALIAERAEAELRGRQADGRPSSGERMTSLDEKLLDNHQRRLRGFVTERLMKRDVDVIPNNEQEALALAEEAAREKADKMALEEAERAKADEEEAAKNAKTKRKPKKIRRKNRDVIRLYMFGTTRS